MSKITEMFNHKVMLDYSRNRVFAPKLGDQLFPSRKIDGLEFDYIRGGSSLPVIAKVHSFDTKTEIGSREGGLDSQELALIKKQRQIKEKDIIRLSQPRNENELNYLKKEVFNDTDNNIKDILALIERMRMEMFSKGRIELVTEKGTLSVDYNVPEEHKGTANWGSKDCNPIDDIQNWYDKMDVKPTRALTSTQILRTIMRNPNVIASVLGRDTGKVLTQLDLDNFMGAMHLPIIRAYDESYNELVGTTKVSHHYLDDDAFVMFNDSLQGETVYGTTPEEVELMSDPSIEIGSVGNIITEVYRTPDPVSHWQKAVAVALPSFAAADEVFQATIDLTADDGGDDQGSQSDSNSDKGSQSGSGEKESLSTKASKPEKPAEA